MGIGHFDDVPDSRLIPPFGKSKVFTCLHFRLFADTNTLVRPAQVKETTAHFKSDLLP